MIEYVGILGYIDLWAMSPYVNMIVFQISEWIKL